MAMFYCPACRKNLDVSLRKNHSYTPHHVELRDEAIRKAAERVAESRFFLDNVTRVSTAEPPFWCCFCEENVDNSKNTTVWCVPASLLWPSAVPRSR